MWRNYRNKHRNLNNGIDSSDKNMKLARDLYTVMPAIYSSNGISYLRKENMFVKKSSFICIFFVKVCKFPHWFPMLQKIQKMHKSKVNITRNYPPNLKLHFRQITWVFRKLCCMLLFRIESGISTYVLFPTKHKK